MSTNEDNRSDQPESSLLAAVDENTAPPNEAILKQLRQRSTETFVAATNTRPAQSWIYRTMHFKAFKTLVPLAAAAIFIIVAAWPGATANGAAWADVVQQTQRSHNEHMQALRSAAQARDADRIRFHTDMLSEFWQQLGWLAQAASDPTARIPTRRAPRPLSAQDPEDAEQVAARVFYAYADQFNQWLTSLEDKVWINETIHVCKQLEEYAEEIRDAARSTPPDLTHVEHCLSTFLAYAHWFQQLPWDDPSATAGPHLLLTAIQRDLRVARNELKHAAIKDADRYARRCLDQARKNTAELKARMPNRNDGDLQNLTIELARQLGSLSNLTTEFAKKGSLADFPTDQFDQALALSAKIAGRLDTNP